MKNKATKEDNTKKGLQNDHVLSVLSIAVAIPLSMSFWIINIIYSKIFQSEGFDGGERTWVQVLCNGGMATQLGILYLIDVGSSERPIDFVKDYRASWLSMGVLGVLACCNGDTWASELGTVLSKSDPYLITSFKKVPKGTNGGISFIGTVLSTVAGIVIGVAHFLSILYFADRTTWMYAPPQWPIIVYGGLGGLIGSMIDSIMGATLQHSGIDKDGKIVSHSSVSVKHISGKNILDNNSVNLISTVVMGLLIPTLSKNFWPLV